MQGNGFYKSSRQAIAIMNGRVNLQLDIDRLREKQDEQPSFDRLLKILELEQKLYPQG